MSEYQKLMAKTMEEHIERYFYTAIISSNPRHQQLKEFAVKEQNL